LTSSWPTPRHWLPATSSSPTTWHEEGRTRGVALPICLTDANATAVARDSSRAPDRSGVVRAPRAGLRPAPGSTRRPQTAPPCGPGGDRVKHGADAGRVIAAWDCGGVPG